MLRIEQSEILKMFYVLAGPRMLLGMEKSEILKFLCPSRTSNALTWQLTLRMFSLHGSSSAHVSLSVNRMNENVDDPSRD